MDDYSKELFDSMVANYPDLTADQIMGATGNANECFERYPTGQTWSELFSSSLEYEQIQRRSALIMTPSQQAKAYGLKTLSEASKLSGVPIRTLYDWHKTKPKLFEVICRGCMEMKNEAN